MPPILKRAPSPQAFADAWVREVVAPALATVAGRDGKLSRKEAAAAKKKLSGIQALAIDSFEKLARGTQRLPKVNDLVEAERTRAKDSAALAAGANRSLSFAEAQALPKDLSAAYAALRGRSVPSPKPARELGIVSDIDKTVLPPEGAAGLPAPYPGVATLFRELELADGGRPGDTTYVTAGTPERAAPVRAWLGTHKLPAGNIETGTSALPWVAEPEKIRDIESVLAANPGQKFILFGDSSHRDPEVYRKIRASHPDQVAAIVIHQVTSSVKPERVAGMHLVANYAEAASALLEDGLLGKDAARRVMVAARDEGLSLSDADMGRLLQR